MIKMYAKRLLLLALAPLLLCSKSVAEDKVYRIKSPSEFKNFTDNVNSGTNYSGTTVYLDSDLSLPEITKPIGNYSKCFFGTFDGQGHIISDLTINSFSDYTGLFGYSGGMTIRNVVLDSSCSITSRTSSKQIFVGGIIGYCYVYSGQCNIENAVNMANITSRGITAYRTAVIRVFHLGGVAGELYSYSEYGSRVKNCANYGSIKSTRGADHMFIGGVVGYLSGSSSNYCLIQNCLNYGAIENNVTASYLNVGGIAGFSEYTYVENCVSAGKISSNQESNYIGSFVGYVYSNMYINNSFWTSDVGYDKANGTGGLYIDDETSQAEVDTTLVDKLNEYVSKNNTLNKWALNANNASVSFVINNGKGFSVSSQIILIPSLFIEESLIEFSGWHTDAALASPFTADEIGPEATLYGMLCGPSNYTVSLDVNGGNASSLPLSHQMAIACDNIYGELPDASKTGYTFTGWYTESKGGDMVDPGNEVTNQNNHTLYAHWSVNNYTVTLDVNGGNELTVTSITVTFNNTYGELPGVNRTGYMFIGWFTDDNEIVTNETKVNVANNHTLHVHWDEVTKFVEIVFSVENLERDEVEEIIRGYVGADTVFTIMEIGGDGETSVIIKFVGMEEAEEFVRNVNKLGRDDNSFIKQVGFTSYDDGSFVSMLHPIMFMAAMLL